MMPFDPFFQSNFKKRDHEPPEIIEALHRLGELPFLEQKKLFNDLGKRLRNKERLPRGLYLFWLNYKRRRNIRQVGQERHDILVKQYALGNVVSGAYSTGIGQKRRPGRKRGGL